MLRRIIYILLAVMFLSACGSSGDAGDEEELHGRKNPKEAKVEVENGTVTITIPARTSYFWLEKVDDDSVPYDRLYFKFDPAASAFLFQTNLDDWQPVVLDDNTAEMGKVKITFGEKEIVIAYPSGAWAFP